MLTEIEEPIVKPTPKEKPVVKPLPEEWQVDKPSVPVPPKG